MRSRAARVSLALVLSLASAVAVGQTNDRPSKIDAPTERTSAPFGIAGGEEILWLFTRRADTGGDELLFLAYRRDTGRYAGQYLPRIASPVTGHIAAWTVRGDTLHAIFSDGSHWSFDSAENVIPGPGIRQTREVNLPQSAIPRALAVDRTTGILYAWLAEGASRAAASSQAKNAKAASRRDDPDATEPKAAAMLRFQEGVWAADRAGPPGVPADAHQVAVWAQDAHLYIAFRTAKGEVLYRHSPAPSHGWSKPITIVGEQVDAMHAGWLDDSPAILQSSCTARSDTSRTGSARLTVAQVVLSGDEWTKESQIAVTEHALDADRCACDLTVFAESLWLASPASDGGLLVSAWSVKDGSQVEPPHRVSTFDAPVRMEPQVRTRQMLEYVVLAVGLAGVFIWRRDQITQTPPLEAGVQLAQLVRRAGAVAIDLALLSPLWITALYLLWPGADGLAFAEQMLVSPPPQYYWGGAIIGGIFGVYGYLMEAILHTTIGKRMCQIGVTDRDGRAARATPCLVRNLARVVEFHFPPLVLLVAMTAGRQRFGDLLASTIVVQRDEYSIEASEAGREDDSEGT